MLSAELSGFRAAIAKLATLGLHNLAEFVEQMGVALGHDFYEIRKRQRRSGTGIKELPESLSCSFAVEFLAGETGHVAKCPAFRFAQQKILFEETVERRHHGRVGQIVAGAINQFADGGVSVLPKRLQQTLFEGAQFRRGCSEMEGSFYRCHLSPEDSN